MSGAQIELRDGGKKILHMPVSGFGLDGGYPSEDNEAPLLLIFGLREALDECESKGVRSVSAHLILSGKNEEYELKLFRTDEGGTLRINDKIEIWTLFEPDKSDDVIDDIPDFYGQLCDTYEPVEPYETINLDSGCYYYICDMPDARHQDPIDFIAAKVESEKAPEGWPLYGTIARDCKGNDKHRSFGVTIFIEGDEIHIGSYDQLQIRRYIKFFVRRTIQKNQGKMTGTIFSGKGDENG